MDEQEKKLVKLHEQSLELYSDGKLKKAMNLETKCLGMAIKTWGKSSIDTLNIQCTLADFLFELGEYKLANKNYKSTVSALKYKRNISDTPIIKFQAMIGLAKSEFELGNAKQAYLLYRKCIEFCKRAFGDKSVELSYTYNAIGVINKFMGRPSIAEKYYLNALELISNKKDMQDFKATLLHNLAGMEYGRKNFKKSIGWAKKSLALHQKLLSKNDPRLAADMVATAAIYRELNNFTQASKLYNLAKPIFLKAYGKYHPEVGNLYYDLGKLALAKKQFALAKVHLEMALKIQIKIFGSYHQEVAYTKAYLGVCLRNLGDNNKGRLLIKNAITVLSKVYNSNHQDVKLFKTFLNIKNY